MLERGWLVVFEGIDGTGKSTQCREMERYLNKKGIPVVRFREPTDGIWGQKIREILTVGRGDVTWEEELSWFIEDRRENVKNNILPALNLNKVVLLDRYIIRRQPTRGHWAWIRIVFSVTTKILLQFQIGLTFLQHHPKNV